MQETTECSILEADEDNSSEPPDTIEAETKDSDRPRTNGIEIYKKPDRWNDWRWQIRNRVRTVEQLSAFLPALSNTDELKSVIDKYPMAITPYYASLIKKTDISDPVFTMSVPSIQELFDCDSLSDDPLEEHRDMPVPGMVHRYTDRVLVIATTMCSMYCRHCTRKRIAGTRETSISQARLRQIVEYLQQHPEVSDVIISGGDPFTMTDSTIDSVLSAIRSVSSVQVIRIGTRVPVVLPMRITDELVSILKKYHPLWINTHFNHPNEITAQSRAACAKLADAGIPLGNQTVLLKGVNDKPQIIESLCRSLISTRVRPYYMYQCDLVRGVEHLRTSLLKGIEIMEYLRGRLSGIAIPTFVVDAPHGGGKIPVLPNYIVSMSPTHTVLRNYEGMLVNYPEPGYNSMHRDGDYSGAEAGVWGLATGELSTIAPSRTNRLQRRNKISQEPARCGKGYLFES